MKKIYSNPILTLALFGGCILFFDKCHKDPDCSRCQITKDEEAFVIYNIGDTGTFKNDQTGELDILQVISKTEEHSSCDPPCDHVTESMTTSFKVSSLYANLFVPSIYVSHKNAPELQYEYLKFILNGPTLTMTVNNKTYNDIYSVSVDSNIINPSYDHSAWKIDYSASKGFVRFHQRGGSTWSRL